MQPITSPSLAPSVQPLPQNPARRRRFLHLLRDRWYIPALTLAFALMIQAGLVLRETPTYASVARMWVSGKLQIPESNLYREELQNFFGTQIELMQSEKIVLAAHNRVQATNPDLKPVPVKLKVAQQPRASVFILQAVGTNDAYLAPFLNAVMDEYLTYKGKFRASRSDDTLASVTDELFQKEKELKSEQEKLNDFQKENSLAVLQEQGNAAGVHLAKLNTQLADLKLESQLIELISTGKAPPESSDLTVAQGNEGPAPGLEPVLPTAVGPSKEFFAARQQLQMLRLEREEMSQVLKSKHPKIKALDEEILRNKQLIQTFHQQNREGLIASRETLQNKMQTLEAAIKEWEVKVLDSTRKMAEYDRLKSNTQRIQSQYDRLLSLLQNVDVNKNLDQEMVSVLERAVGAGRIKVNLPLKIVLACLLGLAVGLAIVYLLERVDDRVSTISDLLDQFDEEVVGQIPEVPRSNRRATLQLLQADDERYMFAESYRNVRSSLLYMAVNPRPKTLLVTSAVPHEGKSTVTANLALTLAYGGAKVLLVDADMRRGALAELFEMPAGPGLCELLQQEAGIEQVISATAHRNLSLIRAGKHLNNPGELFLSPSTDVFLRTAYPRFDVILFDTAPILATDDTTTLAPKIEGVLFVVRGSYTRARLARQALHQLYHRQAKVLGIIYNRANSSRAEYGYYKYGYYESKTPAAV